MLGTPGRSPRHLSSPTPSAISDYSTSSAAVATTPRNPSGGAYPKVLDEDTYVAVLEKIIERDFFPDLTKLRDRLDWLEAIKTRDPIRIRDAQLQIIERRGHKATRTTPNPSAAKTPGSTFLRSCTPLDDFDNKTPIAPAAVPTAAGVGSGGDGIEESLSLDQFVRRYTSEDNESFTKILEKENRKRKERYDYLLEGENSDKAAAIEDAKRNRITDGYGTSDQPMSTLEGWKFTAKNLLMYHPADRGEAPLTLEERAVRMKSLEKEISRTNTRFHGKMMDRPREEGSFEVLYAPVAGGTPVIMDRDGDKLKKYDLDDLRKTPPNRFYVESEKKADNGYTFVKTPSPAPGVDESPFITWGEIEGTPLRLEQEDTPLDIGGSGGPHFRIPCPGSREEKAYSLSRVAARKLREREKLFPKPPLPSPSRAGSASPSVRTLSPAAQKFVRNAIAKSSSTVDETLRASYRGSSPGLATPKGGRSVSRFSTMKSRSPSAREGSPW
ncbi:uncharacterized protein LOC126798650 [Argentina anserina]|uniref:uncharacterized protein LOC126798650 n=1 Tax=Argentina anserina TaxID=57926 RepID=UPI0021766A85|nr:uncharacterized protein LOC126798650 [Potentilla anserina]